MIMNNRQLVGNWAKHNMLRVAMAAMVTMGAGFVQQAEAATDWGYSYTAAIVMDGGVTPTESGANITFSNTILTMHHSDFTPSATYYWLKDSSFVTEGTGDATKYKVVLYKGNQQNTAAGTEVYDYYYVDANAYNNMKAAYEVRNNKYNKVEVSSSQAGGGFENAIEQKVVQNINNFFHDDVLPGDGISITSEKVKEVVDGVEKETGETKYTVGVNVDNKTTFIEYFDAQGNKVEADQDGNLPAGAISTVVSKSLVEAEDALDLDGNTISMSVTDTYGNVVTGEVDLSESDLAADVEENTNAISSLPTQVDTICSIMQLNTPLMSFIFFPLFIISYSPWIITSFPFFLLVKFINASNLEWKLL